MGKGSSQERDVVWVALVWGRVVVGLLLAATGGVAFGYAWTREYTPLWWVGAITLLVGALLLLSVRYTRTQPAGVVQHIAVPLAPTEEPEPVVPLLGAVLVYKYQRISHEQLNQALEQQRRETQPRRRLGEILLAMGVITRSQLEEALAYQHTHLQQRASGKGL